MNQLFQAYFGLVVALMILIWPNQANAVNVSPALIDIRLTPGQSQEIPITLQETDEQPLHVTLILSGLSFVGDELVFDEDPDSEPPLIKQIITLPFKEIDVDANSSQTINLTVRIPADWSAGPVYGALLVRPVISNGSLTTTGVNIQQQLAIPIFIDTQTIPEPAKLTIDRFEVQPRVAFGKPITIEYQVTNRGDIHVHPTGRVIITSRFFPKMSQLIAINQTDRLLLPGRSITEQLTVSNRTIGSVVVRLEVSTPNGDAAVRNQTVWLIPWSSLVVFAAITMISGSAIATIHNRRRQRRRILKN